MTHTALYVPHHQRILEFILERATSDSSYAQLLEEFITC